MTVHALVCDIRLRFDGVWKMKSLSGIAICLAIAFVTPRVCADRVAFPQLISTRYATGDPLPAGVHTPTPAYNFVIASKLPTGAKILSAAHTRTGSVWVVTDKGNFRSAGDSYVPLDLPKTYKPLQQMMNTDLKIVNVAGNGGDTIIAATNFGMLLSDGRDWWRLVDRGDGMPYDNLNCVTQAQNGDVWAGTNEGAWRWRHGTYRYFWGKRWLPGNRVSAIWTDAEAEGRTWFQTESGVACIEEKAMTLKEKAAHYDAITQERHNRRGFISTIDFKVPGHPEKGIILHADDNDGLWTAYYVAAMSLNYATTHDPAVRNEVRKSMNAMIDLERLTGISGYPARSTITTEELNAGVGGCDLKEKDDFSPAFPLWFKSPVEPNLYCKGTTSSDEIDGHYLAWYTYYEYVADAQEKAVISALVRRVTDHIIAHGYKLFDHSGSRTQWGFWDPETLNDNPRTADQRGENSLLILSHLKVAYHITQDPKYKAAYDDLIDNHHYLLNTLEWRRFPGATWWSLNHSDDQMACVAYYPLLMLEQDPARKSILTESIARTWEPSLIGEPTLKDEHSSFYDLAYGALTGHPCDIENAVANLQDWPWELITWTAHNSQRHDVVLRTHHGNDGSNRGEIDRVVPVSERNLTRWNNSPWTADGGNDGAGEEDGSAWLIAYWIGVHHGLIPKDR